MRIPAPRQFLDTESTEIFYSRAPVFLFIPDGGQWFNSECAKINLEI